MIEPSSAPPPATRISQGDILRDVEYIEHVSEESGIIEVSQISFPLVVVLTQDCDLQQDFNCREGEPPPSTQDRRLLSVLVAPLYNVEHVYLGEHLSDLALNGAPISRNSTPGKYLCTNQRPRFHYIEFPDGVPIVPSVVDFKHYFSVDVAYLRKIRETNLIYSLRPLFREDLCQRFSSFLARIGLPGVAPE
jgi:hypothetical protein